MKEELNYKRDLQFSLRHREYGPRIAGMDLDFLFCEYDFGTPLALIEYKKFNAPHLNLNHTTIKALSMLADNSNIPAYVVYYYPENWQFHIVPLNNRAKVFIPEPRNISEFNFVKLLYHLRKTEMPAEIKDKLNRTIESKNFLPRYA